MASYFDLLEVAKTMGLQGEAMKEYVDSQLARIQAEKIALIEAEERRAKATKEASEASKLASDSAILAAEASKLASEAATAQTIAEKEKILVEEKKIKEDRETQLALLEKKAELDKSEQEERKRNFDFKMLQLSEETKRQELKYQHDKLQKQAELESAIAQAKIDKEARISCKQLEVSQPQPVVVTPHAPSEKRYIPRLPNYQQGENLVVFLDRFSDSMKASLIPVDQWIVRLRDILTGGILRTFQDLSDNDKLSYDTVRAKLLASQNLTSEFYRKQFNTSEPTDENSFSDFVSSVKSTYDRWLQMAQISDYKSLYDLMLKNKILLSCNSGLVSFLIERDPHTLDELTRIGDQYFAAHPSAKVQKDAPFKAFACEAGSEMAEDEMEACAAQTFPRGRSQNPGRSFERGGSQKRSFSEQRSSLPQNPQVQATHANRFRDFSTSRGGCFRCGSLRHMIAECPVKRQDDNDRGGGPNARKNTGCFICNGPHIKRFCRLNQQAHAAEADYGSDNTYGTQQHSQDQRVSKTIYPALLAVPESAPLTLGKGFVGKRLVSTLFDTGANIFGIDKKLVPKSAYTGKFIRCRTFSGRLEIFPQCQLYIRTPFYTGYAIMSALRKPIVQLIIGQLKGVKKCTNQEIKAWYKRNGIDDTPVISRCGGRQHTHSTKSDVQIANVIMTRSETRKHQQMLRQEQLDMKKMTPRNQQNKNFNLRQHENLMTIEEEDDKVVENAPNSVELPADSTVTQQDMPNMIAHDDRDKNNNGENKCEKSMQIKFGDNESDMSFATEQRNDSSLKKCFSHATTTDYHCTKNGKWQFYIKEGILFRYFASPIRSVKQLVVPSKFRTQVLETAHDSIFGGHLGHVKTLARIRSQFHWPGIVKDVKEYVRSCHICQKMAEKGSFRAVPVQESSLAYRIFQKISIDLVGEISPPSARGHRYLLTVVDSCSRWADAIPLKYITSQEIATALMGLFCKMGFPDVILSDNGPQFVSRTMRGFTDMLSIAQTFCSIYHAMGNGVVEKFHRCLKQMLSKVTASFPTDWDLALPAVLFAFNDAPHASTGISSHEIVFGTHLRGPLSLLRDSWVRPDVEQHQTHNHYLSELRKRIIKGCQLARENLADAGEIQREYANRGRKLRTLKPNDDVLIMLPEQTNTLLTSWQGPFTVVKQTSPVNYLVDVRGNHKLFHINMLKRYHTRAESLVDETSTPVSTHDRHANAVTVIDDVDTEADIDDKGGIPYPVIKQTETWKDVKIGSDISINDRFHIQSMLQSFSDILTDVPGSTDAIQHRIILSDNKPVVVRQYPIPLHYEDAVKKELTELLNMKIVEHADSPYSSPLLPILKKDQSLRLCVDYRKLNQVTLVQQEPMPDPENLFPRLARASFFSKFDLTKGYWQVKVHPSCRHLTAFSSPLGQLQFNVVPFGIASAPMTFTKLMRKVTHGRDDVISYLDDMLVFHSKLSDHIKGVSLLLETLRNFGLTVRPSKTCIAVKEVTFLGFTIGDGKIMPEASLINKILKIQVPKTRKQVRSLLGLLNFYRTFLPRYSELVACLHDLLKGKTSASVIKWSDNHDIALRKVQTALNSQPFLRLPDLSLPFHIFSDASTIAVGGILCQRHEGIFLPTKFLSSRLTPTQTRWHVQEIECYAIICCVNKWNRFLAGRHFYVYTDNQSLSALTSGVRPKSKRIHRWLLMLAEYSFTLKFVPSSFNKLADYLSREPSCLETC